MELIFLKFALFWLLLWSGKQLLKRGLRFFRLIVFFPMAAFSAQVCITNLTEHGGGNTTVIIDGGPDGEGTPFHYEYFVAEGSTSCIDGIPSTSFPVTITYPGGTDTWDGVEDVAFSYGGPQPEPTEADYLAQVTFGLGFLCGSLLWFHASRHWFV